MMVTEAQRVMSIQYLRGIAAAAVVLAHITSNQLPLLGEKNVVLPEIIGFWGVDIFFVISGFIIVYITSNIPSGFSASRSFLCKRIIRIVPAYWFFTLLFFFLDKWSLLGNSEASKNTVMMLVKSMLFIKPGFPLLFVGWTLTLEMFFYFTFSLCMIFLKNNHRVITACCLFMLLAALPLVIDSGNRYFRFYTQAILLEFAAGMLIASTYQKQYLIGSKILSWVIFLAGCMLLMVANMHVEIAALNYYRAFFWGIPAVFIVQGALGLAHLQLGKAVAALGSISYSLYLCHMICIYVSAKLAMQWVLLGVDAGWLYVLLAVTSSLVIAAISYWFFEMYLDRKLKRIICV
jgi:exopolysaccharide production protein ExoZ